MELKKISIIALTFMFVLVLLEIAQAAPVVSVSGFDTGGSVYIDMNQFTLNLDLKNSGDSCAYAVIVTTNSIFLTDDNSDNEITEICKDETLGIILGMPPNIIAGTYPITIMGSYTDVNSSRQYTFSDTLNIYITGNSILNAHIVSSTPLDVYAGDTATISVLVENDGTSQAQSINGVLSANEPLEVKSAESFFSVGILQPKQSYNAQFSFDIPKDAQSGTYPMNLELQYVENNEEKTKTIPLSFEIKKRAMFETSDGGSDILYPKDSGKILKIRVTNDGTDVAKEMKVQMQPQYPFTTDGSVRYVDNLGPGQSSVVEFAIDVDKSATIGNYGVNLILDYQDSQGNNLHDSVVTSLKVQSKPLSQAIFGDYWYLWMLGEIVLIVFLIKKIITPKNKQERK